MLQRGYYFSSLKPVQRNTDFPLNIGYNNYFKHHALYKGSRIDQLKLSLKKKNLEIAFRDHYHDLLQAIASKSFDQLEILCEEQLTMALAAAIYKTTVIDKQSLSIVENGSQTSCEIINNFFVKNMLITRKLNTLSIDNYHVKEISNTLVYELKNASEIPMEKDEKSLKKLNYMLQLKDKY